MKLLALLLLGAALATLGYVVQRSPTTVAEPAPLTVTDILAGEHEGFKRALNPASMDFPRDHGAHPEYRSEWWYFTGHLHGPAGRRFGYQLTLFRHALRPALAEGASPWRSNQIMLGHLNVSDFSNQRFISRERLSRAAAGLAGFEDEPVRIWLHNWTIEHEPSADAWNLSAASDGVAVRLQLRPLKRLVLHGERGLSRKSEAAGNASYYYSSTRLDSQGTLHLDGERFAVAGQSWLDREWSTSSLDRQQSGWDWFSVQLSNQTELMYYQLRNRDGSAAPQSAGTFVAADGSTLALHASDVQLSVSRYWRSPHTSIDYPNAWRLVVPRLDMDLEIESLQADQEVNLAFRYWEGAVTIAGIMRGSAVDGDGYVELTGYDTE